MSSAPRVLAIVGLTGTGKSELAIELARACGAEVIGADSMQVYRGMDVGTAKPSRALREEIPHHGIDIVDPDEPMSAGRWARHARCAAADVAARGRPVVLCGGTGLYARAFAGGLVAAPESNPELRGRLEALELAELRARLEDLDPAAAARIHMGDRVRMVRALEVQELRGAPLSELQAAHRFADRPFDVRWLGLELPQSELWAALRARTERMFREELVEETRALRARFGARLRPLAAIGYHQAGQVLDKRATVAEAIESTFIATRQYARRQRTWFRAQSGIEWLDARDRTLVLERALAWLELEKG